MIDQIFDRNYQGARHAMNGQAALQLERLFAAAANAFKVLNRIEYSAPWTVNRRTSRGSC